MEVTEKMAAELIFSVDAHISLTHSGGKPYERDQCKYSSKTAQNLKTHKLTCSGKKPCACDQCKCSPEEPCCSDVIKKNTGQIEQD